jgi:hypothetical protein
MNKSNVISVLPLMEKPPCKVCSGGFVILPENKSDITDMIWKCQHNVRRDYCRYGSLSTGFVEGRRRRSILTLTSLQSGDNPFKKSGRDI